jgi:hypothetical protein
MGRYACGLGLEVDVGGDCLKCWEGDLGKLPLNGLDRMCVDFALF